MENDLYTAELRQYIHNLPWPKGLDMRIYTPDDPYPHILFMFFRDNLVQFDSDTLLKIGSIVNEMMTKLRKDGVPCHTEKKRNASEAP